MLGLFSAAEVDGVEMQLGYRDSGSLGPLALPGGSPTNNYTLTIGVRVFDTFGAVTNYTNITEIQARLHNASPIS